jgi:hypothetical protein
MMMRVGWGKPATDDKEVVPNKAGKPQSPGLQRKGSKRLEGGVKPLKLVERVSSRSPTPTSPPPMSPPLSPPISIGKRPSVYPPSGASSFNQTSSKFGNTTSVTSLGSSYFDDVIRDGLDQIISGESDAPHSSSQTVRARTERVGRFKRDSGGSSTCGSSASETDMETLDGRRRGTVESVMTDDAF